MLCLLLALGAAALLSAQPWESDSVAPRLSIGPDVGIALGDSSPVPSGQRPHVAGAKVAGTGRSGFSIRPVSIQKPHPGPLLGISQRYAVGVSTPAPSPVQPPSPTPPPTQPVVTVPPQPASSPAAAPAPEPVEPPAPRLVANFEEGFKGWSTAVLGDSTPRVVSGIARDGSNAILVRLTGDQSRSQLILGGEGGYDGAIQIHEGDEFAFAFSFYIQTMVYGEPGADNLIMQMRSDASESQIFGLQLWDYPGDAVQSGGRGLWSSGEAVAGDRFLAAASERAWHDAIVHFKASRQGAGFYEVYLDGQLVDARDEVSLIAPGSSYAQIEVGLFRDGDLVQGTSEMRLDAAKFGESLESVLP